MFNSQEQVVLDMDDEVFRSGTQSLSSAIAGLCELAQAGESFTSNLQAALAFHDFGLNVIPVTPGEKKSSVTWDYWFNSYSRERIEQFWKLNPKHDVGFVVGDDAIVLDADSFESISALHQIEHAFGIVSKLIVKTRKGVHHYYRVKKGAFAKSDSHCTEKFPDRIDVKTKRSLVVLPPSGGREIEICDAEAVNDLSELDQTIIDAIFRHNGRDEPRPQLEPPAIARFSTPCDDNALKKLGVLLQHIDPDSGYEDWLHTMMIIYRETGGSEEGFNLANDWSSQSRKYKGRAEIRSKWNSFNRSCANPVTIGTLYKQLETQGVDWKKLVAPFEALFEVCDEETEIVMPSSKFVAQLPTSGESPKSNVLDKFAINGMAGELEKAMVKAKPFLGNIAVLGQATILYAQPT